MFSNPTLWSAIGFWILVVGLVGDVIVLFVPSGKLEKTLAAIFTAIVIAGVTVEHVADAQRFGVRDLSEGQQNSIAYQLSEFVGQDVEIFVYADDPEISHLGDCLRAVMSKSRWNLVSFMTGTEYGRSVVGILIELDSSADTTSRNAAAALASALGDKHLEVQGPQTLVPTARTASGFGSGPHRVFAPIRVTVGKRPP
jgi:hypothetical protein